MRFIFIAAKRAEHTVSILCRCLRVTRSGFYAWLRRPESRHAGDDRRLKVLVRASFAESQQRYGSPRIHEDLIEQHEHVEHAQRRPRVRQLLRITRYEVQRDRYETDVLFECPRTAQPDGPTRTDEPHATTA